MLEKKLQEFWDVNKFATSWIISSSNLDDALESIKSFAHNIMQVGNLPIDNNPDFHIVKKEDTKSITIDQVRKLQDFLSTTPAVCDYKFAVIFEADLMNNNASNCCLKILEEPPRNTYLFLLSNEPTNLSATIKSRCHKLHVDYENLHGVNDSYNDFIEKLSKPNISQKMTYLKDISAKQNLSDWESFCQNSMHLLLQIQKNKLDSNIKLTPLESDYLNRTNLSNIDLDNRIEKVKNMVRDSNQFELDKKHMGLLILECLT